MDYFIVDKLINLDRNYEKWNPLKYINQRYFFVITSTPADNKLCADYGYTSLYFYNEKPFTMKFYVFFLFYLQSLCFIDSTRVGK